MNLKPSQGRYFGNTLKTRTVCGLSLRESQYPPRLKLSSHFHECAYFCFVLRGCYEETWRSNVQTCGVSTLTLRNAGEKHADHFKDRGGQLFSIELGPEWVHRLEAYSVTLDASRDFLAGALPQLMMRIYREFRNRDDASSLAIEGLALELMVEASRTAFRVVDKSHPRQVRLAKEFLHANFSDQISLAGVAKLIDAHPAHLARLFRKHCGCTPGEYLRQVRIEFACQQMVSPDEPLSKIALAAGFCDQAHFSKTFRRIKGMTPSEYQSAMRC
jgi:AraC family transcriptional regulator